VIQQEAAGRVPYNVTEAEIRHFDTCQTDPSKAVNRDIIIMACHRPKLEKRLDIIERAGFSPLAVDVEPIAVLRSFTKQHRRESDKEERVLYVHIGNSNSMVVIAEGDHILFVKYIEIGGVDFDKAVSSHLNLSLKEATSIRRHHGDRRKKRRDSEVTKSLSESTRTVIEKLCSELSMCIRYHSVTFRGKPLVKIMLTGGEANEKIQQDLCQRLSLECELGDPIRNFENCPTSGRAGQWDVASGLALKYAPETTIYQQSQ
jgi:type IV pilus assembly protein PilM